MILSLALHKFREEISVAEHIHINTDFIVSFKATELFESSTDLLRTKVGEGLEIVLQGGIVYQVKCNEEDFLEKLRQKDK